MFEEIKPHLQFACNNTCLSHGLSLVAERLLLPTVQTVQRTVVGGNHSLKGRLAYQALFGQAVKKFSPTRWMGLIEAALKNFSQQAPNFSVRLVELQQLAVHADWPPLRRQQLMALLAPVAAAAGDAVNAQQNEADEQAEEEDADAAPRAWRPAQMRLLKPIADLLSGQERLALELCLARDLGIFLLQLCYEVEGNGFLMPFVTTYIAALEPALREVADKQLTVTHFPHVLLHIATMPVGK